MLDASHVSSYAFYATMFVGIYKGPSLISLITNAVPTAPKDREVRSSKVVDEAVAVKLARKSQQDGRVEAVRTDALVDEELGVGPIES